MVDLQSAPTVYAVMRVVDDVLEPCSDGIEIAPVAVTEKLGLITVHTGARWR